MAVASSSAPMNTVKRMAEEYHKLLIMEHFTGDLPKPGGKRTPSEIRL
jgi:hypothetical protein